MRSTFCEYNFRFFPYVVIYICIFQICWFGCTNTNNELKITEVKNLIDSAEKEQEAKNILASFDILSKAREQAHKYGLKKEYARSLNQLALIYAYIDDFEEALQLNKEMYENAESNNDTIGMMEALNNKGVIINIKGEKRESLNIFHKLLKVAIAKKDSSMTSIATRNIAALEIMLGNTTEAMDFIDTTICNPNIIKNDESFLALRNMQASIYKKNGYLSDAASIYDSILSIPDLNISLQTEVLRKRAVIEAEIGNRENAFMYLKEANRFSDPLCKYLIYLDYSNVNEIIGDYKQAILYRDSALMMMDSIYSFAQSSYHRNSNLRFSLLKKEEETNKKNQKIRAWSLISLSLILSLIITYLYLSRKRKVERLTSKIELMRMQEELKKTQQEHSELKIKLDDYIDRLKCNELSMVARDNLMKEVTDYLSSEGNVASNKIFLSKMNMATADLDNLDSFLKHTRQTNPVLFSNLIELHPDLNPNDLRYISLVYLQLSINEIASLLNISPAASKKRKQRICKKIGLDSTGDLFAYLLTISKEVPD